MTKSELQVVWAQVQRMHALSKANPPARPDRLDERFELKDKDGNMLFSARYDTLAEALRRLSMIEEPSELRKLGRKTLRIVSEVLQFNIYFLDKEIIPEYNRRMAEGIQPATNQKYLPYKQKAEARLADFRRFYLEVSGEIGR